MFVKYRGIIVTRLKTSQNWVPHFVSFFQAMSCVSGNLKLRLFVAIVKFFPKKSPLFMAGKDEFWTGLALIRQLLDGGCAFRLRRGGFDIS